MKSPLIWLQAQQRLFPFPSSSSSPEVSELLNVKSPVQSDTENPHVHSHLFIRGIMHWETLLHCQGAFCEEGKAHDEESQVPFPPQLQCHRIMSASQPPCLPKQGTTPLKTRYFQIQFITIHLFQSPVLWSFTKLLFKWSSVRLSAVVPLQKQELDTHTLPLHQDPSLRGRHPGQHLGGTKSF